MPTYEFRCPDGHEFDHFYRSISASQMELPCPRCGKTAQRLMSAGAGLHFKGSGFYITDYGKDGKKDQRPAAKSDASPEGSASGAAPASSSEKSAASEKPAESPKKESAPPPASSSGSE